MQMDDLSSHFRDPDFTDGVQQARLNLDLLTHHLSRFLIFKNQGMKNSVFKIQDSCRVDNGRIVPYDKLEQFPGTVKNVASFLPAAGSSTRYVQPIYNFKKEGSLERLGWILPRDHNTKKLLSFQEILETPKALYPCVKESHTFLEMKFLEQEKLEGIDKTICVIPSHTKTKFLSEIQRIQIPDSHVFFWEQGPELSTLRLNQEGIPIHEDAKLSIVPAGHGALLNLFPVIKEKCPHIESLFIRNIDNVIGCRKENVHASNTFLRAHAYILERVKKIRKDLFDSDYKEAAVEAKKIIEVLSLRKLSESEDSFLNRIKDSYEKTLWTLQIAVFQTPLKLCEKLGLSELFSRPLNILGQVPNLGSDKGGTPVVIENPEGETAICLELPHLSEEDAKRMQTSCFASHFNPVFAAVELQESIQNYEQELNPYWIFAEKIWRGDTVYYHESLLYEMIGNSKFANLIFVEMPRSIFNPHKTLDDTRSKSIEDWID